VKKIKAMTVVPPLIERPDYMIKQKSLVLSQLGIILLDLIVHIYFLYLVYNTCNKINHFHFTQIITFNS